MSDRAKNGPKPGASKRASPKRGGPKPPRKPPRRPNARAVATEVLFRVQTDGAWAAPTLDAAIGRARLDARDAALATAIVYGALRVLPSLDAALDTHLKRPGDLDDWTRAALRVAAFQIRHLPRVPPRAAVHEAVDIVRAKRGRLAGLTNAVLRKLRRPEDAAPPTRLEVPTWVAAKLEASLGAERAETYLASRPLPPPIDLRVEGDRATWAETLRAAAPDAQVEEGVAPRALHVRQAGDPRALPGWEEGAFTVQEQGSQLLGALLGATAGERVLDACAGRGGKTTQLARAVGDGGEVVAADLHEARLEQIEAACARLGLGAELELVPLDWTVGDGGLAPSFDRALVDAPCSG
ncbi:MAG: Sun protein, partial [Myxococcales bacterium]|nr:Sun protein [Myxococcales bacterium]